MSLPRQRPVTGDRHTTSFTTADSAMLAVAAIWGGSYAIVKDAYREIDPMPFLLVRFTLASLALVPVIWRLRRQWPVGRSQWLGTVLVGLVGIGAYQLLFSIGLQYTTASNSTLIISTSPLFTALLAPLAGLGRPTKLQWASLPISLAGVYLLTGAEGGLTGPYLKGNLLSLAAALSVGASFTLAEKLLGK
ncbi:MAG TPA: DMT family transporter, partial [Sphingobacteriaceae bacterium]|nr:DMT family transporter [Sphingobacteriaceae bacterium]